MDERQHESPERNTAQVRESWAKRRHERVVNEILANRRGEYTVPTWVLAATLAAIIVAWIVLIIVT